MRANTGIMGAGGPVGAAQSVGRDRRTAAIVDALGDRSVVLVGMMGAGKTVMGRRLAAQLSLDFVDSDAEIEAAAGMTIPELFALHGELYFRERETRVVERLLRGGPRVVATGGGAFINQNTRAAIKTLGLSLWIRADFDVLMRRVRKRSNRPLLQTPDPEGTLRRLIAERYPVYAEADVTVVSHDGPHEVMIGAMIGAIETHLVPGAARDPHHAHARKR